MPIKTKKQETTPENFCDSIIEAANSLRKQCAARRDMQQPVLPPAAVQQLREIDRDLWDIWELN